MGGVCIRVEKTNADAAHTVLDQFTHLRKRCGVVEWFEFRAIEAQPPRHLADKVERDQALRLYPEERVAISVGHRLARDFKHVTEAARHKQAEPGEFVLE